MAKQKLPPTQDDDIHPVSRRFLFLGDQKFIDNFIWLPVVGLAITIMGGIMFPFKEGHAAPWDFFASWAFIGFLAYCVVVYSADPLFRLLSRDENYYGEGGDDA